VAFAAFHEDVRQELHSRRCKLDTARHRH
jgi:hypothetical protein